ncbi:MAG: hypothetical protein WC619_05230 [Patescibacteria group bacterium]
MDQTNTKNKLKVQLKNLAWRAITTVILTLTAVITVWVYAAFVEPLAGPNDSDQDFLQNILGANNADNDFDSSLVTASSTGSIIEGLEYLIKGLFTSECGESTTSTQTNCYVDDTVRYLTTDLCNEAKENQCFVPTDNGYYTFNTECSDSTTTTTTNCYVDDTVKYVDSNACLASSNSGYCYMDTANFSAKDSDLVATNIKNGVTIFGVSGNIASAEFNPDYPNLLHIAAFVEPSASPADFDQDFTQNILGANNADNDFNSSLVTANRDGSIIERLKYLGSQAIDNNSARLYSSECGESTTSTQTNCYVDDTARYLVTDLCNETKENQCFVPTDNSYYAFGSECSDSTTSTQTNCYVDDTARYVDSNACLASSNDGYCYMNTANFSDMDTDLAAGNIRFGITIFGITGTYKLANGGSCSSATQCTSGYCADSVCCNNACSGSTCQRCDSYSNAGAGTCGYVSSGSEDPDGECTQGSETSNGCRSNYCTGSSYACGVQATGDGGCPSCYKCADSDIECELYSMCEADYIEPSCYGHSGCVGGSGWLCCNGGCCCYSTGYTCP